MTTPSDSDASPKNIRPFAASPTAKGPVKPAQDGPKGAPPVKPVGPQPQPGPQTGPNKGQRQPSGSNQGQGPAKPGPNAGPKAVPPRPGPVPGGPGPIAAAPKPVPAPKPPQPAQIPAPAVTPDAILAPPARPARMRGRHWGIIFSFLLFVLVPIGIAGWYLYERAVDQFASTVGFSVRQEEGASGIELLAGLSAVGSSSSTDADILYEFIQSQKLVADIDAQIDLASMWSIAHETDPFFGYDPDGTIEDLLNHWERKVRIFYDSGTGLIEVRALAFTAQDANAISRAIFDESSAMINALSDIARADSIGYARAELEVAEGRLRDARGAVTDYRNRNQIVDPSADLQNQAGLIGNLQAQLAEALIEVDLLTETTQLGDPRIEQSQLRVRVIEDRINEERRKMGIGDGTGEGTAFADLVGEFERLSVEREFAENTYIATLASFDAEQAEARRQTRYLAAHVQPTLAQRAEFPQRLMVLGLIALFIFVIWSIIVLVYYSLKDRR
ncbi:MAG: capsular polysaccharide transport system permease protein [Gammaproteobacteria bacterium]